MINDIMTKSKVDLEVKAQLLKSHALSVFNNPMFEDEISALLAKLDFSKEKVIDSYINYDLDIFAYSNEIYNPLEMRMVMHLHNMLVGSWHIERQITVCDFLDITKPKSIIDIGFGVPSFYVKRALEREDIKITLTDIEESAFIFGKSLLEIWNPNWEKTVDIYFENMIETSKNPPESELYLFQDSIEHVEDPTECLKDFVKNTKQDSEFILSLPIGPIIPVHYIAWETKEEIKEWLLDCGLKVTTEKQIHVNPDVDLFAKQLDFEYTNLIVLCNKL